MLQKMNMCILLSVSTSWFPAMLLLFLRVYQKAHQKVPVHIAATKKNALENGL